MQIRRPLTAILGLLILAPSAASAALCIHDEELYPLIQRFAEGTASKGSVQVWEGDACDRAVPPGARLTNPKIEVFLRPGEDPRKRSKAEQKMAAEAAKAFTVRGVGGQVELQLVDRDRLFVDPSNPTATFIFRIRVSRVVVSSAAGSAANLDADSETPCRSYIRLGSTLSKGPLKLTRDKYVLDSDPKPEELKKLGDLDLNGLLTGPYHQATFTWAEGTGGQSLPITVVVDGPAGRQTARTMITNKCAAAATLPEQGVEGVSGRIRLGYPIIGAGLGYDWSGPDFVWSFSMGYDYDYTRDDPDETENPGGHTFNMTWRAGPLSGDVALMADVTLGIMLRNASTLIYSPRFVIAPKGLPFQMGAGLLGVWDGKISETGGIAFAEWVIILQ